MLCFDMPPTRDRYVAEVRNLLAFDCRPICIVGRPRASLRELRVALGGARHTTHTFLVGGSVVALSSDCTVLYEYINM